MSEPRRLVDPSIGTWINARLMPFNPGGTAGSVVPTGFPRVVRVLHPLGDGTRWSTMAAAGREMHPLVQWCCISPQSTANGRSCDLDPQEGSAPAEILGAILDHCPATGDVIHGVWHGWGTWLGEHVEETLLPGWGGRAYVLFAGPKAPHTRWPGMEPQWPQSANLIWPTDLAWCIATEIDWDFTLIAGDDQLAEALLADPRLEAYDVAYTDDLSWHGDRVNPKPPWLMGH